MHPLMFMVVNRTRASTPCPVGNVLFEAGVLEMLEDNSVVMKLFNLRRPCSC